MGLLDRALGAVRKYGETKKINEARQTVSTPKPEAPRPSHAKPPPILPPQAQEALPPEEFEEDFNEEPIEEVPLEEEPDQVFTSDRMPEEIRRYAAQAMALTNIAHIPNIDPGFIELAQAAWEVVDDIDKQYRRFLSGKRPVDKGK